MVVGIGLMLTILLIKMIGIGVLNIKVLKDNLNVTNQ